MNNSNQTPGGAKASAVAQVRQVALELAKAHRAFELYPAAHPQLQAMIGSSFEKIHAVIDRMGEIVFTVSRDGLFFQGQPLEEKPQTLAPLTSELHIRQIRKFAFRQNLERLEFMDFLQMFLIPAEEFRSGKRIYNYFREKRIRTIWVDEVDFGRAFAGPGGGENEPEKAEQPEPDKVAKMGELNLLIEALDAAQDGGQAQEVVERIDQEIETWTGKEEFPEQWHLMGAVSDFLEQKRKVFPAAAEKALAIVKKYSGPNFLSWLVNNFMSTGEATGRAYNRYFEQVGEPALKVMLERVATPESIYFQKVLITYLRRRGKTLRPLVESLLTGPKGAPNLKLVYLLGEFRMPESVPLLLELANSSDPALQRECIRAFGKIKGKKASLALTSMLRDKNFDRETRLILIQTLGEMQELIAVPGLISLLQKRQQESEVREKSAEALGAIGSREALNALTGILKKPGWFRRPAPAKVQLKAAESLARIGGERAEILLRELSDGEGLLAQYCRELVAKMEARKRS